MCRNHRGFHRGDACLRQASVPAALYLNTMFAGPQLVEVTRPRGAEGRLVYDEEFSGLLDGVDEGGPTGGRLERGGDRRADPRLADRLRRGLRP